MKSLSLPQILVAISAFAIPFLGGQISTDQALPVEPGISAFLVALLGGPLLQGFELPLLSHLVLIAPIGLALAISLANRSVIQLPNIRLTGILVGFFGLLFISTGLSDFRLASLASLAEWLTFALAFFASVTILGRERGPKTVLASFFVGVCILALYGIGVEYQQMRAIDPTYRIFAGWVNPNAAAGMFVLGLAVGLGILAQLDRVPALLAGIGLIIIGTALFLTGSKAGFGAAAVAVVTFAILAGAWSKIGRAKVLRAASGAVVLLLALGLFNGIQAANRRDGPSGPNLGRVASFSETETQSLGFRKLLWQGSVELTARRPTGFGIGTYRFEGSRPGLTTQTQLAHNNLLQLAVEASWLTPLLLLAAIIVWCFVIFRGIRAMPESSNMLRAGIVAALAATFAHGMFESNLYYFGIGLSFFLLMGVALCLSADSVAPEFTPKFARLGLAVLSTIPALLLAYFGWAEWQRAQIRFALQKGDAVTARNLADGLSSAVPMDGEAWNIRYLIDPRVRGEAIHNAANRMPSPRILRNLAKYYQGEGKVASAESAIQAALERDPNNLNTLRLGWEIARQFNEPDRARKYAERMVAVEATPYFQIRALPQMVETATADARVYLAEQSDSISKKIELLSGALDLYGQYATTTVPEVQKFSAGGTDFGGETPEKAIGICQRGIEAAKKLAEAYRSAGTESKAREALDRVPEFESAIESLGGSK